MGLRDLLTLPRKGRRARSKNKNSVDPPEGGQTDLAESDLEEGPSTSTQGPSTPVPPIPRDGEPDGT